MRFKFGFEEQKRDIDVGFGESDTSFNANMGDLKVIYNGQNGATFTPFVSEDGVISWTNDRELPNPTSVNIRGRDGIDGTNGIDGYTPIKGIDYFDGQDGRDGRDGQDGYTPIKGIDYFDGAKGEKGDKGEDGYTPIKGIDYFDGEKGDKGDKGDKGEDATVEIVDGTGKRTDAVMSQKATTDALATKLDARKNGNKEYPELYQVSTKGDQGSRVLQSIWQDDETVLIAYSAAQRDEYGCVQVGTPRKGVDTVNRKYADEHYAPIYNHTSDYPEVYTKARAGGLTRIKLVQGNTTAYTILQRDGNGCIQIGTPKTEMDGATKGYVDDPNSKTKTIYWSNIQGGEYTVKNGEYCVGFCDENGDPTGINPTSGGLRFIGSAGGYIDGVSIRGFGKTDCLDYYNEDENGIRIVFTESYLAGDYIVLNFRELPCPTGAVMLLIDVIY